VTTDRTPPPLAFALLGLLSLRPWTTYELAQQSEKSLRWFFPRAERGVYQEAKRLVGLGWAGTEEEWTGRRKSTVYRITPQGRRALRGWLVERGAPLQVESEGLMKLFFSERAGTEAMRAGVEAMRADARSALRELGAQAAQWESGERPFRERWPTNAVSMNLVAELQRTVLDWADWAGEALDRIDTGPESAGALADEFYRGLAQEAVTDADASPAPPA